MLGQEAIQSWFDEHADECQREGFGIDLQLIIIGEHGAGGISFQSPRLLASIQIWTFPKNIDLTIQHATLPSESKLEFYTYENLEDARIKLSDCFNQIKSFRDRGSN